MNALELFQSGKLQEAIQALGEEVRNAPLDAKRRIFLFELLCFAGDYDRAEKHLDIIAGSSQAANVGALLYRSAIHAERTRQKMFEASSFPMPRKAFETSGHLNAGAFAEFADADPRIGGALEVFVAGSYSWIDFEQIASIEVPRPKRLRDLLWTPAIVLTTPEYKAMELGEVLLPVLSPLSWKESDDSVRLGRSTTWKEDPVHGEIPVGQKMFLAGEECVPILELGKVELSVHSGATDALPS
jgi:type VI secretion system protein ImpE